jgi:hypothetical protein
MFLRSNNRKKDGKDHRYFSIVENHRIASDKTVQRTVLYLGEINDQQQAAWRKALSVFDEQEQEYANLSLFPDDREIPADAVDSLQVKLSGLELRCPRLFGSCCWDAVGANWALMSFGTSPCRNTGRSSLGKVQTTSRKQLLDPGASFVYITVYPSTAGCVARDRFSVAEKNRLYRCSTRAGAQADLFLWLREVGRLFGRNRSTALRPDEHLF